MRFDILAMSFNNILFRVWSEWYELEAGSAKTWTLFVERMGHMCSQSFLRPELFDDPKAFNNCWTI